MMYTRKRKAIRLQGELPAGAVQAHQLWCRALGARWIPILIALIGVAMPSAAHGQALATPSTGVTPVILARGTLAPFRSQTTSKDFAVAERTAADVVMARITIAVGGNTGWHMHHGPVFAYVQAGHLAVTRVMGPTGCITQSYGPGQAFVEDPDMVHMGRNAGSVPVVIFATYTNVPVGGAPATSVPAPAHCR
jgi:quercetin dioxygenase-like cupin family protein